MKRSVRRVLTSSSAVRAAFAFNKRAAPIFMLHRFRGHESAGEGHDPAALRANLTWLRANKCPLVPLTELLDRLAEGAPTARAVAFTVDDGYADFASVAAPIFAEFDCPVTVFVTTGFLDGHDWMWWDKLAVALRALAREGDVGRTTAELKMLPEAERLARIERLIRESDAGLPAAPPPAIRADHVERCPAACAQRRDLRAAHGYPSDAISDRGCAVAVRDFGVVAPRPGRSRGRGRSHFLLPEWRRGGFYGARGDLGRGERNARRGDQ